MIRAANEFLGRGRQLKDVSKEEFQLGTHLTSLLAELREDLINGKVCTPAKANLRLFVLF